MSKTDPWQVFAVNQPQPEPPQPPDRDDLIDIAENAMMNVHDMNVTFRRYAEAAVDALLKELGK